MPFVYGSFVPNYCLTSSPSSLGSNALLYPLITPTVKKPSSSASASSSSSAPTHILPDRVAPFSVDVVDCARAHMASLMVPAMPGRRKRLLVSHGGFTWEEASAFLRVARPELAERLPKDNWDGFAKLRSGCGGRKPKMDCRLTEELTGMRAEDYIPWQKTLLSAVDDIIAWEKRKGFVHPRMLKCKL
jgi:hypothetical protein